MSRLQEKRLARMSVALGPDLKEELRQHAQRQGTNLSNYVLHVAVQELEEQGNKRMTSCDELGELRRALELVAAESDLTVYQRLWVLGKITRFQAVLLGKDLPK